MNKIIVVVLLYFVTCNIVACPEGYFPRNQSNFAGGGLSEVNCGGMDSTYGSGCGADSAYGGGGGLDSAYGGCGGLDTSPCGGMYTGSNLSNQYCSNIPTWPRYIKELVESGNERHADKFIQVLQGTGGWGE